MFKKSLAILLSILMFATLAPLSAFAEGGAGEANEIDYQISNPYEGVDWDSYTGYRAALHNHSNVSDGDDEIKDMIEKHYELGYDVLAMTDHGTSDRGWVNINYHPLVRFFANKGKSDGNPQGLTQERFDEISTGADRNGQAMLRVPYGIELNAASPNNTHINSWFVDYGNGSLGTFSDYYVGLKGVQDAGGLCVINHPGEYTAQRNVYDPDKAYEGGVDNFYVRKFSSLLLEFPNCIGIDINSKTDSRTKNERKLWDNMLMCTIPEGRSVFAIATSDAHRFNVVDCGWTIVYMPENSVASLRTALETGAFFAGSMYIKNQKELLYLKDQLGDDFDYTPGAEADDDWEWAAEHTRLADGTAIRTYAEPVVNRVTVDNDADTISIDADNAKLISWIADGKVIATGNEINLNDYSDKIGSYVRAEIFGDGGILYSQAFTLDYEGAPTGVLRKVKDDGSAFTQFYNAISQLFMANETLAKIFGWIFQSSRA